MGASSCPSVTLAMRRPIVGVVGAVNHRLDFELLRSCASLDAVGTLLSVGPIQSGHDMQLEVLRENPKCRFSGSSRITQFPRGCSPWMSASFRTRKDAFNHYRSPMRLFDHLASGRPVATDACDQIRDVAGFVEVAGREDFCDVCSRFSAALLWTTDECRGWERRESIRGVGALPRSIPLLGNP